MKAYEIRITEYALEQLHEIVRYISETLCAGEAARDLLAALRSAMAACAEFPARNPAMTREPWHSRGIRRIIVKNFYAYYWIDEAAREVWFIAVLYSGRNQTEALLKAIMQE